MSKGIFLSICALIITQNLFGSRAKRIFQYDNDWVLSVDLEDFKIEENQYDYERSFRKISGQNDAGFGVSIFMVPAAEKGSSKKVREYFLEKLKSSPLEMTEAKAFELRQFALSEYMVKSYQGQEINQKHLNVYIAKNDLWIDIHISKTMYTADDKAIFDRLVNSIKIENKESWDYFTAGFEFFKGRKIDLASKNLTKAFQLENKKRTFNAEEWDSLLYMLGLALDMNNENVKASKMFLLGIKTSPENPKFPYSLACSLLIQGQEAKSMEYLKHALTLAKSTGKQIPNIQADGCFEKVRNTPAFQDAIAP